MWNKPVADKANIEELDFVALNDSECMEIDGGDFKWLGGCIAVGGACNFENGGGLAVGVCLTIGVAFGKKQ